MMLMSAPSLAILAENWLKWLKMAENEGKSHIPAMELRHTLIDPSFYAKFYIEFAIFNNADFDISSETSQFS